MCNHFHGATAAKFSLNICAGLIAWIAREYINNSSIYPLYLFSSNQSLLSFQIYNKFNHVLIDNVWKDEIFQFLYKDTSLQFLRIIIFVRVFIGIVSLNVT